MTINDNNRKTIKDYEKEYSPFAALLLMVIGTLNVTAMDNYDFQELCMALGKGGPWAVNDGGDAGFVTVLNIMAAQ